MSALTAKWKNINEIDKFISNNYLTNIQPTPGYVKADQVRKWVVQKIFPVYERSKQNLKQKLSILDAIITRKQNQDRRLTTFGKNERLWSFINRWLAIQR